MHPAEGPAARDSAQQAPSSASTVWESSQGLHHHGRRRLFSNQFIYSFYPHKLLSYSINLSTQAINFYDLPIDSSINPSNRLIRLFICVLFVCLSTYLIYVHTCMCLLAYQSMFASIEQSKHSSIRTIYVSVHPTTDKPTILCQSLVYLAGTLLLHPPIPHNSPSWICLLAQIEIDILTSAPTHLQCSQTCMLASRTCIHIDTTRLHSYKPTLIPVYQRI